MNRLLLGLAALAVLLVLTWTTIADEQLRWVTTAILALFAVKTMLRRKDVMERDHDSAE